MDYWRAVELCVRVGAAIISQAANTGLTGGSTPDGDDYGRPVIVINTMRIKGIHFLRRGEQVVTLPGTTLDELEKSLEPMGREPHSVIGSSCLGASVTGGFVTIRVVPLFVEVRPTLKWRYMRGWTQKGACTS